MTRIRAGPPYYQPKSMGSDPINCEQQLGALQMEYPFRLMGYLNLNPMFAIIEQETAFA